MSTIARTTLQAIPLARKGVSINPIPEGTRLTLTLGERGIATTYEGRAITLGYRNAHTYFGSPFTKAPSMSTLGKWTDAGVARSVTGKRVECDGHGDDGSPSWMLVLGMV